VQNGIDVVLRNLAQASGIMTLSSGFEEGVMQAFLNHCQ
jgi:hypothetical protein